MADLRIRVEGRAGRITLTRPKALNALTHDMCLEIEAALDTWAADAAVALVVIDAEGERAFCAGGDVAAVHSHGTRGDYGPARAFWRDEYRMNAKLFRYRKPVVSLMQGFVMGGGVGLGCHVSHRVVGETTRLSMPESVIGLVPDVGGSLLLARAPGRLGEYLAVTAARMGPGDAIHAGFADRFVPEADWPALVAALARTGDAALVGAAARTPPEAPLAALAPEVDRLFAGATLADIVAALRADGGAFAARTLDAIAGHSPLSMACAVEIIHRLRGQADIEAALALEFRFTFRALPEADFLEGVRARIIDKDNAPRWRHAAPEAVTADEVSRMLAPLGEDELELEVRP